MENDRLKNIWKGSVSEEFSSYTDTELNTMVVNSAKKSIRSLYPKWVVVSTCMLAIAYLVWKVAAGVGGLPIVIFHAALAATIIASLAVMLWSFGKMKKYSLDLPLKEWLRFRINAVDRSIRLKKKYVVFINVFTISIVVIFNALKVAVLQLSWKYIAVTCTIEAGVVLLILFVSRRFEHKRYSSIKEYLQYLYNEISKD